MPGLRIVCYPVLNNSGVATVSVNFSNDVKDVAAAVGSRWNTEQPTRQAWPLLKPRESATYIQCDVLDRSVHEAATMVSSGETRQGFDIKQSRFWMASWTQPGKHLPELAVVTIMHCDRGTHDVFSLPFP
jgi:hypothetical protein